ncbi:AAA family ATPase [Escherichia coli]|uniref:ATP-dependent nuclease n=1 Tax=Escherichia coli TaxID=562 RepID=UPI000B7FB77D|nr:AAA family ATPase [Escherichia coli]EFH6845735.1 AAA family ATPase [Escherichia coli]EFL5914193.1 AAA family ATPase [Escherichia coli]EHC9932570.1 AAA family ATPase [Escherichia coli]EHL3671572.1 AAA family ATPase [Escherichia coli]EJH2542436.1 AAA family ATPase [Escherichia coli]
MKITQMEIKGFKSFDNVGQTININSFTSLIGGNGTGKTAVLLALTRMFGVKSSDRIVQVDDFYVPPGDEIDTQDERELSVRVKFEFADLQDGEDDSVADFFKHLVSNEADQIPYCIAKLKAKWTKTNLAEGDIDSDLVWEIGKYEKNITAYERSKIHVHYVPAYRDPAQQLKQTAGTIMHRLINAVEWSEQMSSTVDEVAESIGNQFQEEIGVQTITSSLSRNWKTLFSGGYFEQLKIQPVMNGIEDVLKHIDTVFMPTPVTQPLPTERLSDGMKSLFYLSLVKSAFDIEDEIINSGENELSISVEALDPPNLTIILIEEPENHLSPQYLGRIVKLCEDISENDRAQVVLTTHAPSLLNRVEPENIRYFRLHDNKNTVVKPILLPSEDEDDGDNVDTFTYVKEAVKAYPEIYFAKVVILGEGDSEEIVIPKIAQVNGIELDTSLITFAPLGGRYVNHFWKLLDELSIPHVTLLDYDHRRGGGGWGRIKYALKQLVSVGKDKNKLLIIKTGVLSDKELEKMHTWGEDKDNEIAWMNRLKEYNVYFSYPYDLDWLMLNEFYEDYKTFVPKKGGPKLPKDDDPEYNDKVRAAIASVLKKEVSDIEIDDFDDHDKYFWYRYLFLGRGKPLSHNYVLSKLKDGKLRDNSPEILDELIETVRGLL